MRILNRTATGARFAARDAVKSFRAPRVVLSLAALAAGVVLIAVAHSATNSGDWTFRVAVSFAATPVDPALSGDPGPPVFSAICANLYRYAEASGTRGGRLVPEIAAGPPRISRDARTYTFSVRRGFRFNDGVRVSAANFAAAINRALDPAMASGGAALLADVVGADEVCCRHGTNGTRRPVSRRHAHG